MTAKSPRDGHRPRARRLLSRLAALLVVGTIALGGAAPAAAETGDGEAEAAEGTVGLAVSTGAGATIEPGGPLVSTITLTNDTDSALGAAAVSLEVNPTPLTDGSAVDTWLDIGTASGAFSTVATEATPEVAAGEAAQISTVVDAVDLGIAQPGVYAVRARLSGSALDDTTTTSLTATTVAVVAAPGERTVAVLVPITATPADGSLLTAQELTELTAQDGALTGQLDAVTGTAAVLAVDPAIPTAIRLLGTRAPQTAIDWLDRLERLPNDIFTLQFADADPTTQVHAKLPAMLEPLDLSPLLQPDDFPASTPGPTPAASPTASAEPELPDNTALAAISGAQTDILWPRADVTGGDLTVFDTYLGQPATTILPSTALDAAAGPHSAVGDSSVLVTDAAASTRLSAAAELTELPAIGRELAAAAGHLFFAAEKSDLVLVGLDRSETRSPVALRSLLSTFASPTVGLAALRATPPASATLTGEADTTRANALTAMLAGEERLRAFSTVLDVPAFMLAPERIRLLRTIAVGVDDETFAADAAARAAHVQDLLGSVSIQRPKPVQLITSAAPLPVWIRNDLPWTVRVLLHSDPSDPRLDIKPVTEVEALAASSTRVDVPIEARVASGEVEVDFRLTSPTGVPIGQPAAADVTLRADWEGIGIGILAGIIALLFVFGLIRTVRRRRQSAADADAVAGDAGADAVAGSAESAATASGVEAASDTATEPGSGAGEGKR